LESAQWLLHNVNEAPQHVSEIKQLLVAPLVKLTTKQLVPSPVKELADPLKASQ
jgi:hypothetical protein